MCLGSLGSKRTLDRYFLNLQLSFQAPHRGMDPGHLLSGEKTEWPRLALFHPELDLKGLKSQLFLKKPLPHGIGHSKGAL